MQITLDINYSYFDFSFSIGDIFGIPILTYPNQFDFGVKDYARQLLVIIILRITHYSKDLHMQIM